MEEGELGRELGEFGGDAVDDIGDLSAVRVNDVIVLWREVPSLEGKADDNCSEFHVGGLGANWSSVVKGEPCVRVYGLAKDVRQGELEVLADVDLGWIGVS